MPPRHKTQTQDQLLRHEIKGVKEYVRKLDFFQKNPHEINLPAFKLAMAA